MSKLLARIISSFLCTALAIGFFAGCNSNSGGKTDNGDILNTKTQTQSEPSLKDKLNEYLKTVEENHKDDPVKLRYFHFWENKGTIEENLDMVAPIIKKKFNIIFDEIINPTSDPSGRLNLMINGGDIPDVIVLPFSELSGAKKRGMDGLFLDVAPYMEKYANINELYTPYIKRFLSSEDGKMYALPLDSSKSSEDFTYNKQGMFIRKKIAEKLGINQTDIKTPEDLFNILMRIRDEVKEFNGKPIIPYALGPDGWGDTIFYYIYGANWHNLMPDDKSITFMFNHPGAKKGVIYLNKLYNEGLLEKDCFIHKNEQFEEKLSQGRYAMIMHAPFMVYDKFNPMLQKTDPDDEYIPVSLPIVEQEHKYFQYPQNPVSITAFSKKLKNPERVFEFINWAASDEGYLLTTSGVDGVFYNMKDGKAELNEEGQMLKKDPKKQATYGLANWYRFAGYGDKWKAIGGVLADDPRIREAAEIIYKYKDYDDGTSLYPNPDTVVAPLVPFRNDGWNIIFKIWGDVRHKTAAAKTEFDAIQLWDKAVDEMNRQAFDKMKNQFEKVYQEQLQILLDDKASQEEAKRAAAAREEERAKTK